MILTDIVFVQNEEFKESIDSLYLSRLFEVTNDDVKKRIDHLSIPHEMQEFGKNEDGEANIVYFTYKEDLLKFNFFLSEFELQPQHRKEENFSALAVCRN